jgi:hypothetical protein
VPIRVVLKDDHSFGPDEVAVLVSAFEDALRALGLNDRQAPTAVAAAKLIIEFAKQGESDPARLRDRVVKALGK